MDQKQRTETKLTFKDSGVAGVSNCSKALFRFASDTRGTFFKETAREGCIPESFVGNYAVI
jgi:hypothetical protein